VDESRELKDSGREGIDMASRRFNFLVHYGLSGRYQIGDDSPVGRPQHQVLGGTLSRFMCFSLFGDLLSNCLANYIHSTNNIRGQLEIDNAR